MERSEDDNGSDREKEEKQDATPPDEQSTGSLAAEELSAIHLSDDAQSHVSAAASGFSGTSASEMEVPTSGQDQYYDEIRRSSAPEVRKKSDSELHVSELARSQSDSLDSGTGDSSVTPMSLGVENVPCGAPAWRDTSRSSVYNTSAPLTSSSEAESVPAAAAAAIDTDTSSLSSGYDTSTPLPSADEENVPAGASHPMVPSTKEENVPMGASGSSGSARKPNPSSTATEDENGSSDVFRRPSSLPYTVPVPAVAFGSSDSSPTSSTTSYEPRSTSTEGEHVSSESQSPDEIPTSETKVVEDSHQKGMKTFSTPEVRKKSGILRLFGQSASVDSYFQPGGSGSRKRNPDGDDDGELHPENEESLGVKKRRDTPLDDNDA